MLEMMKEKMEELILIHFVEENVVVFTKRTLLMKPLPSATVTGKLESLLGTVGPNLLVTDQARTTRRLQNTSIRCSVTLRFLKYPS